MRRTQSDEPKAEEPKAEVAAAEGKAETEPAPKAEAATPKDDSQPRPAPSAAGRLTDTMALPEPPRTEALEKLVNSGETFLLQSRTGRAVRCRYGEHILLVPPQPKPFMAAHAIHLLFTAPDAVEEVGMEAAIAEAEAEI